jgi:DNA-binding transcriptional ArsR family regulator
MSGTLVYWVPEGGNRIRSLKLTVCSDEDHGGVSFVRRKRLSRLLKEASMQGAKLSYADLCMIMLASRATLKRDMNYLRKAGYVETLQKARGQEKS